MYAQLFCIYKHEMKYEYRKLYIGFSDGSVILRKEINTKGDDTCKLLMMS